MNLRLPRANARSRLSRAANRALCVERRFVAALRFLLFRSWPSHSCAPCARILTMLQTVEPVLSPSQRAVFEWFGTALPIGNVFHFWSHASYGRTTVLRALHARYGGDFVAIDKFVRAIADRHPLAIEEALHHCLLESVRNNSYVFVDDLHLVLTVLEGCGSYPRPGLFEAHLMEVADAAAASGCKMVFATDGTFSSVLRDRSYGFGISELTPADYDHLCRGFLGEVVAAQIDFAKVHRFAPRLDAHQLKSVCRWLGATRDALDTDILIEYLRSQELTSNVELGEVAEVNLRDLCGVDDVIQSLETNVVLPLENDALAQELDLHPKRGVLLVGPPGTGKTSVGRALARRLRGKFFLIDGTAISGTDDFYHRVHRVYTAAIENAPSVVFVDDSDVIFESGREHGLYRYLLTMLDGLESKSAARVCVMMTAMDIANIPPALVRSGRIELWLEMRSPDAAARRAILEKIVARLPPAFREIDIDEIAGATDGFTGADLKRTIEDGKTLYAFDRVHAARTEAVTSYFLRAVSGVRDTKSRYAQAEDRVRPARDHRPAWFDPSLSPATIGDGDDAQ
jgi:ATP-dependent 26S proteasome regulatory subunit